MRTKVVHNEREVWDYDESGYVEEHRWRVENPDTGYAYAIFHSPAEAEAYKKGFDYAMLLNEEYDKAHEEV